MPTDHRPVPLPNRGKTAPASAVGVGAATRPDGGQVLAVPGDGMLPAGAERFSKSFYDTKGAHRTTRHGVPVNRNGEVVATAYECRRCGSAAWFPPVMKQPPLCPVDGRVMRLRPDRSWLGDAWVQVPWGPMARSVNRPLWAVWAGGGLAGVGAVAEAGHTSGALLAVAAVPAGLVAYPVARRRLLANARRRRRAEMARGGMSKKEAAEAVTPEHLEHHLLGSRGRDTLARHARTAGYCAAAACGWTALAATTGLNPHTAAGDLSWTALAAVWAYPAATWWRWLRGQRRQEPAPAAATTPSAKGPLPAAVDPRAVADAAAWAEDVATAGTGGLKTTTVDTSTWQPDVGGRRMVIRASRGAITGEAIRSALPAIAGAFDVKRSSIGWIEEYEDSPRAALLLLQPNSPLNKPVPGKPIDIIDLDDAVAHMGMRIDGSDLQTRLFTPGWGAPSRLIIGTKGSGKTAVVRRLLFVQLKARVMTPAGRPTRLVAPFGHDPKIGAEYGLFRRLLCGFSTAPDTLHMIVDAFAREMDRRYESLASVVWEDDEGRLWEGEKPFDPATMGPILSLTCDEFHINAKDQELMAKLDPMGRKMRAAAIELNIATHLSTIGDTGSQGFRDMTAGGEAWLLRTTLGLNAALATGGQLTGDPRSLPREPGMLLHAAGDDATMQARAAFDEPKVMYDQLYGPGRTSLVQPVDWPPETLEAFGPDFCQWMRDCQGGPLGSAAPSAPRTATVASGSSRTTVDGQRALDALLLILVEADGPLSRPQIVEAPVWAGRAVSTLSAALRAGQALKPPLLRKVPDTAAYEPTEAGRDVVARASARSDEEQLVLATESGEAA